MNSATQYTGCFVSETGGLALSDPAAASCLSPDAMPPSQTGGMASNYLARAAVRALIFWTALSETTRCRYRHLKGNR